MSVKSAPIAPQRVGFLCLSALGDLLLAVPLILAVRSEYPSARITLICMRAATAEFGKSLNLADEVVSISQESRSQPGALFRSILSIRALRLGTIFQTFASHGAFSNLLAGLSGAKVRSGFDDGRFRKLLSHRIPIRRGTHYIPMNLEILQAVTDVPVGLPTGRYLPTIEEHALAFPQHNLIKQFGPFAVVSVASDPLQSFKRWPEEKWIDVLRALVQHGLMPIMVGMSADRSSIDAMLVRAGVSGKNLAGCTELPDLVALVLESSIVVGTDGMIIHLAASLAKRCVAIFGPTDPEWCGPWLQPEGVIYTDIACRPCCFATSVGSHAICASQKCLEQLEAPRVIKIILDRLATEVSENTR